MTLACRPLPERVRAQAQLESNATLLAREDLTDTVAAFHLERDQALVPFAAGQYVSVGVIDRGHLLQRPYSIVSLSSRGRVLEFLIKRLADGELSPRLWQLGAGARVRVGPARGLFVVTPSAASHHVFVAAGTGLAPFLAMLAAARRSNEIDRVTLIHGVSNADELAYRGRIEAFASGGLNLDYRPSVSRPTDPRNRHWNGACGRAEDQLRLLTRDVAFDAEHTIVYLCGGSGMVEESKRVLLAAGVSSDRVRAEKFHSTDAPAT